MRYSTLLIALLFVSCNTTSTAPNEEIIYTLEVDAQLRQFVVIRSICENELDLSKPYTLKDKLKHPMKFIGTFSLIKPDTLEVKSVIMVLE